MLQAIRAAVSRETPSGAVLQPDQAISVHDALAAYTTGGAVALGLEHETGSITEGKIADLVLLGEDPLTTEPEHLPDIRVRATWRGGVMVFGG